ncbi:MAG: MbcA/ParS/Xre antitoxin family protein [Pseudolabrys sp.]
MDASTINAGLTVVTVLLVIAGAVTFYVRLPQRAGHAHDNALVAAALTHALNVFESPDSALEWLRTPNQTLGARPLDLLADVEGRRKVEHALRRIGHGGQAVE